MKYETEISGSAKFWHPSAPSDAVEAAFGMPASIKNSVGELRSRGDKAPYKRTYCSFEIVPKGHDDLGGVLSNCIFILRAHQKEIGALVETGGELYIAIKISSEAIQMSLDAKMIGALSEMKAGLLFEVHDNDFE